MSGVHVTELPEVRSEETHHDFGCSGILSGKQIHVRVSNDQVSMRAVNV